MPGQDATPSWSGYIFQGEVALCKAIETINQLDNVEDEFCLQLEQDEDFSIKTDSLDVFQVKAYLSKDSDKLSKYKNVIEEIINKYYYSKSSFPNPFDKRKKINIYSLEKRKKPIKSCLITHANIGDYDDNLNSFLERFNSINFDFYKTIHGEYCLDNINTRLNKTIKEYLNDDDLSEDDINYRRMYCCQKVCDYIKNRHLDPGFTKKIPFSDIEDWLKKQDVTFVDSAWFYIERLFTNAIIKDLKRLDVNVLENREKYERLETCLGYIEKLEKDQFKMLIERIAPHKDSNFKNKESSFGYIESSIVENIVNEAIMGIKNTSIDYSEFNYLNTANKYQISTINEKPKAKQEIIEIIKTKDITDTDYFITEHLDISKDDIEKRAPSIMDYDIVDEEENEGQDKINKSKRFGFKNIENAINELNK